MINASSMCIAVFPSSLSCSTLVVILFGSLACLAISFGVDSINVTNAWLHNVRGSQDDSESAGEYASWPWFYKIVPNVKGANTRIILLRNPPFGEKGAGVSLAYCENLGSIPVGVRRYHKWMYDYQVYLDSLSTLTMSSSIQFLQQRLPSLKRGQLLVLNPLILAQIGVFWRTFKKLTGKICVFGSVKVANWLASGLDGL